MFGRESWVSVSRSVWGEKVGVKGPLCKGGSICREYSASWLLRYSGYGSIWSHVFNMKLSLLPVYWKEFARGRMEQ